MDDAADLVGIVTVTFNSATVIRGFLKSLLRQDFHRFRLYAVDNASSDETLAQLEEFKDERIVVIRNSNNVGVAEGNNIGIRAALADNCGFVLLINNDTEFGPDLLDELVKGLGEYDYQMVVPKILYFDQPNRIWAAGGYFSRMRGSARHFGSDQLDSGKFDKSRFVDYSPTCCMLIRSAVFAQVGLMDSHYFVYFDDTDFCFRARKCGVRLGYLPTARLLHKVSSLTGSESEFTIRYCVRNHVYYMFKNFPFWKAALYLPALQVHLVLKCLFVFRQWRAFATAEKALVEGVQLFVSLSNNPSAIDSGKAGPSR
jgi:GT2 family glycosyltransferase